MELIRTHAYARSLKRLAKLGASDVDLLAMKDAIAADTRVGDVVPGSGGLRKARFAYGAAGKRGGGRTIYYAVAEDETVYLLVAYAKVDTSDLTARQMRLFKNLVEELTR